MVSCSIYPSTLFNALYDKILAFYLLWICHFILVLFNGLMEVLVTRKISGHKVGEVDSPSSEKLILSASNPWI